MRRSLIPVLFFWLIGGVLAGCGGGSGSGEKAATTSTIAQTTTVAPSTTTTTATPTTTTLAPVITAEFVAAGAETDGFFIEAGTSIARTEAEEIVGAARASDLKLYLVVLGSPIPVSNEAFAQDVFDALAIDAGTVFVLTADEVGWVSFEEAYTDADFEAAADYADQLGGDDGYYAATFMAALTTPASFYLEPGTPVGELTSFTGTVSMVMTLGDLEFGMNSEGTFTTAAFECNSTVDFGGFSLGYRVIATPRDVWIDRGQGFEETSLYDEDVNTAIGVCPASPEFWLDFESMPLVGGESETLNDIPTQRVDLTQLVGALQLVGFEAGEGIDVDEATMWLADPGGWTAGLDVSMTVDLEQAPGLFGPAEVGAGATAQVEFSIRIRQPNDQTLAITNPQPAEPEQSSECGVYEGVACRGSFTDDAGIVDDDQRIEDAIGQLVEEWGNQIAIVVINDSGSMTPATFAANLGNEWGVGDPTRDDGIVVLVSLEESRTEVVTGPGVEIPEVAVAESANAHFAEGDFEGGLLAIIASLEQALAEFHGN